jgi:hypothetical protein
MESTLDNYQTLGVQVRGLDKRIEEIKKIIADARTGIENDDLKIVKASVSDVDEILNSMTQQMPTLEAQKLLLENKWNISGVLIIIVISAYMITQVVIPSRRLGAYIKSLAEEEQTLLQARKTTEKQYFMRKIDEPTFRGIMLNKQAQINKAKAALERSKQERSSLVRERVHPKAIARWFKNGFVKIGRSIKSAPRKIYNKIRRKQN